MAVQYNKLWKRLIDMKVKKSSLTEMAGVSASTCEIGDIVELSKEAES